MKEKIYKLIAHSGIWLMQKLFPEYFAVEPMRPTDRYIEYPFVLKNLPKEKVKILDVGCSGSIFPLVLNSLGYETYGIDIRNYPNPEFNFYHCDMAHSLFEKNLFDVITAVSTIEHVGLSGRYGIGKNLEKDKKVIEEIYRILKPNGMLLMTVPYGNRFILNKDHRIYDCAQLNYLLNKFEYTYEIKKSPEADYNLALIKAIKND